MARIAENAGLMKGSGGATRLGAPHDSERELAALRDHVERTIARSPKLSEMAERIGFTPADVASEALARFLRLGDPRSRTPPAGWWGPGGTSSSTSTARASIARSPGSRAATPLIRRAPGEEAPIEETLDRRYENKLYDAAVRRLDPRDQRAIAAFEVAGSMRAVEKEYGIPKSSVQRAFKRLQAVISSETGRQATRRARSRALAYHLGYMSPPQAAEMKARLSWDTGLLMAVRSLELGGRRAVALLPPGGIAADAGSNLEDLRIGSPRWWTGCAQHAYALAGRGSGHEAETAGGIAGGGASAGFATKAIVAACIGGSAAAGVGGACVATGVVDLPAADGKDTPVAQKTMPEPTVTEPTATEPSATTPTPVEAPPSAEAAQVATVPDETGGSGEQGTLRR